MTPSSVASLCANDPSGQWADGFDDEDGILGHPRRQNWRPKQRHRHSSWKEIENVFVKCINYHPLGEFAAQAA